MSDQCRHCACCGDMDACDKEECSIKESWYTRYLEEAVRVRDQRATTFNDNDGIMRVVTCMYCGARLYLGDPHCGFCETVTHPLKGKGGR